MPSYVVLTKLNAEGRKRLHADPSRLGAVRAQVEAMGARVTTQYAVLGGYDFLTLLEAPDNVAVERIQTEISGLGTMRSTVFPAIGMPRFIELLKMQPYRTEPHAWQTSLWARAVRRAGRYWTTTRYVRQYCKPLTVEGLQQLNGLKGGAVVIANHSSHFDSPVVFSALPPRIRHRLAMAAAADKFYASRKKRVWWPSLFQNAFPVHRGGGTKQLEYPLSLLKRGWSILIYPEGGRSKSGQIARFKGGPAIMAMAAGVPVIPIYMEGLRAIMPKGTRKPQPGPVRASIGKPISLAGVSNPREATEILENAMRELAGQPPHHHAVPEQAGAPAEAIASASIAGGGS